MHWIFTSTGRKKTIDCAFWRGNPTWSGIPNQQHSQFGLGNVRFSHGQQFHWPHVFFNIWWWRLESENVKPKVHQMNWVGLQTQYRLNLPPHPATVTATKICRDSLQQNTTILCGPCYWVSGKSRISYVQAKTSNKYSKEQLNNPFQFPPKKAAQPKRSGL